MIDWLTKLPDSAIGLLLAGTTWFGFNYAVLGERAMQHDLARPALAACVDQLDRGTENRIIPRSGIGELLGIPELDALEARIVEGVVPKALGEAEKLARCSCAVASAPRLRLDYAVHTASFRVIPVEAAAGFRERTLEVASSPICS